jgi:hypothetical protein
MGIASSSRGGRERRMPSRMTRQNWVIGPAPVPTEYSVRKVVDTWK